MSEEENNCENGIRSEISEIKFKKAKNNYEFLKFDVLESEPRLSSPKQNLLAERLSLIDYCSRRGGRMGGNGISQPALVQGKCETEA